jgi:hypothetical protein
MSARTLCAGVTDSITHNTAQREMETFGPKYMNTLDFQPNVPTIPEYKWLIYLPQQLLDGKLNLVVWNCLGERPAMNFGMTSRGNGADIILMGLHFSLHSESVA